MPDTIGGLPNYQIARLLVEFFASVDEYLGVVFPNRLAEANIFLVVARTSLPDWISDGRLVPPAPEMLNTVRVHAIAASLTRSPETMRRHVRWLVDNGFVGSTPAGVAVSTDGANLARTIGFYTRLHDLLIRFMADVAATTDYVPSSGASRRIDALGVLSRTMDAMLATLEPGTLLRDDPIGDSMWCAVNALNVRAVTYDPVLARRFAGISVPDEWRRPVSLTVVAALLGVPYATIWRKAAALAEHGMLRKRERGWIVPQDILDVPAINDALLRHGGYFMRKMREIERLGLMADGADASYLAGRPPLAAPAFAA